MPYLVLDLEMTGNDPTWHEIIQIGAVIYDNDWNLKGEYLQNVYPENEEAFSSPSEKIHGLSLLDLKDAPMMYDVLPEFEDWIRKSLGKRKPSSADLGVARDLRNIVICGQSVINDINFLQYAYSYEKLKWPYSYKLIDLHTTAYLIFRMLRANDQPVPKKLSLTAIAKYFGLEREGDMHNALEDSQLTAACFIKFFELMEKFKLQL